MDAVSAFAVRNVPAISPGDALAPTLIEAIRASGLAISDGDVIVVCQKAVSKAEGRVLDLGSVVPSPRALRFAEEHGKDPRVIEVVLRESRRIVRMERGLIVSETASGLVCANAGVDRSNAWRPDHVTLLPLDPDAGRPFGLSPRPFGLPFLHQGFHRSPFPRKGRYQGHVFSMIGDDDFFAFPRPRNKAAQFGLELFDTH